MVDGRAGRLIVWHPDYDLSTAALGPRASSKDCGMGCPGGLGGVHLKRTTRSEPPEADHQKRTIMSPGEGGMASPARMPPRRTQAASPPSSTWSRRTGWSGAGQQGHESRRVDQRADPARQVCLPGSAGLLEGQRRRDDVSFVLGIPFPGRRAVEGRPSHAVRCRSGAGSGRPVCGSVVRRVRCGVGNRTASLPVHKSESVRLNNTETIPSR